MDNKEAIARIKNVIKMMHSPRTNIPYCQEELEALDLAIKALEKRQQEDIIQEIPKDFVYDTETSEFYCYRNKYTGEEIHIIKSPKTYMLERPQGRWIIKPKENSQSAILICNKCKHFIPISIDKNYCPNCGADMSSDAAVSTNTLSHKCYTISRNKTTCDVCGAILEGNKE